MSTFDPSRRPSGGLALSRWYARAFAEQQSRGLSMVELASEVGVSVVTLYQWRRRLSDSEAESVQSGGLIELKIDEPRTTEQRGSSFRLDLDSRGVLEIPCDFDAEALGKLLEVLRTC